MASEIVRTLNKQLDADLLRPKRDQFADPETFITEFIPSLAPQLQGQTLLLTFDEFDTLSRPDIQDTLARPLINYFRQLFDVACLNFIFSIGSSGNKLENMQASYTNFFKSALYRKISFLSKNECRGLITKPVKGVITYQSKAVQRITQITSGHPYFTQLMCHELFSRCQTTGSREITPEDVDDILDDVIERGTVNLKFVWDEATDLEKWVLAVLGEKEGISQKEISTTLKSQGIRFVDSDLNSAVLHLRDKDVLTKDNQLVIHLMKLWLEINRPMDRVREELVQTNPIADRYIEIGDELRDRHQFDEAVESYQRALEFQENNISALLNIANIFLNQHKYTQAAASFEKALQVNSEHIAARQGYCQAQLALGDQARQSGDVDAAIAAYQAILNRTPVYRQARENLAAIYQEKAEEYLSSGNDTQALDQLRLALEMTPEDEKLSARRQQIINEKKAALVKSWFDKAQRALRRKRWDEAVKLAQEALKVDPDDQAIQKRVAAIKDAPRQEKLKAYRKEAETAIAKGNYPKAIAALESAILLSPEDTALTEWLESTRSDQQHAQLRMYQTQAEEAQEAGDWDAAITAREAAIKLDPEDETLAEALTETKADQKNAQLRSYQKQAESAQAAGDWEAAIAAREQAIKLDPENETLSQALAKTQAAQRQAKLDGLLAQADSSFKMENWSEAVSAWEAYLTEVPEDAEKLEERLAHARKYAQLSADYTEAQEHIHKKQFSRAISKLQGIIAQDPTYKATSRLLTEAVEGSRQRKPIWRKPWLYVGLLSIVVIALATIFRTQIIDLVTSINWQKPRVDAISLEPLPFTSTANQTSIDPQERFTEGIFSYMERTSPTFEDDFSSAKPEWGGNKHTVQFKTI
ncbi:MAG: tetratricopeptide repeat protein [Chloroflexota bacterium]|nr:tetratricopeptide repeat protein [Chloroflexota bacterium]